LAYFTAAPNGRFVARIFRRTALGGTLAVLALTAGHAAPAQETPVIAAASSLNYALSEIAELFTRETGERVKLVFGSSGNFARQIAQGAPYEVFLSADDGYLRWLRDRGLIQGKEVLYGLGRLALFAPHGSPLIPRADLGNLAEVLKNNPRQRFAIANPDHAPYGRAAREIFIKAGLWPHIRTKIVLGENASQATQFAISGSAVGGLIPYSQALVPSVGKRGTYVLVPQEWHSPIRQSMVLLRRGEAAGRRFFDFLQTAAARNLFTKYGFVLSGEGP